MWLTTSMAPPQEVLNPLGELDGPAERVRSAVDNVLAAARDPESALTVGELVTTVEQAVYAWVDITDRTENGLRSYIREFPEDRLDIEARLGGLALLHLAIASDVATIAPLDDLPDASRPAELRNLSVLPEQATTSLEVLTEGELSRTLSRPMEEEEPDDPDPALAEDDLEDEDEDKDDLDDVIRSIIGRAGRSGTAVVTGLGGLLSHAMHPLHEALSATPEFIRDAFQKSVRRIARLVKYLIARAVELFNSIFLRYREVVSPILAEAVPTAADALGAGLIGKILDGKQIRTDASAALQTAKNSRQRNRRLRKVRKVDKLHQRWVGPVRLVAAGLPGLSAVLVGPVPASAIAAVVLLAWTVVVTGDQLDAHPWYVTNFWPGVVARAGGT
jgi:hypothetical protein